MARRTHDFFVFYEEDDNSAVEFVRYFANRWEKYGLKGIYHERDGRIGEVRFDALQNNINRSVITVIVMTKEFVKNAFTKYGNVAALTHLLDSISTTPQYIPVGVGLADEEFPSCIQNVVRIAKFPEFNWEEEAHIWRQLDNVLVEHDLLSDEQKRRFGFGVSLSRSTIREERFFTDAFLKNFVSSKICGEYFGLGIGLGFEHQRLEQISKIHRDPADYNLKMLVTWREESEKAKTSEADMCEELTRALREEGRNDICFSIQKEREAFEARRKAAREKEAALVEPGVQEEQPLAEMANGTTRRVVAPDVQILDRRTTENEGTHLKQIGEQLSRLQGQTQNFVPTSASQGFVSLHEGPGRREKVFERNPSGQIQLGGEDDADRKKVEESPPVPNDPLPFDKSVPWWVVPVTVVVAVTVTIYFCRRS